MFARQTGKTFTTTLELVDDCFEMEALGRKARWVILSRGERQAKEAMEEGVKKTRHRLQHGDSGNGERLQGEDGTQYTMLDVVLPGGGKITACPPTRTRRAAFPPTCFDEFAFHADSRKIWGALFPVISNGYKLRVTSTPNGKGNKFYDLMTMDDGPWSKHVVDIYQAVKDGLRATSTSCAPASTTKTCGRRNTNSNGLDEASAWLSFEPINGVEHDQAGRPELYAGGPCFLGVDIAARNDLFVIWVAEQIGDVVDARDRRTPPHQLRRTGCPAR